jgi:hypothetical protein
MAILIWCTVAGAQTKEERLYQIKLRQAEVDVEGFRVWMEEKRRKHEETQQLFEEGLVTLQEANRAARDYEQANLQYEQQKIALERLTLGFLEDALHLTIIEARKYRTPDGRRMVDVTLQNASDLDQAMSLHPGRSKGEVTPLLEVQNIIVSITSGGGTTMESGRTGEQEGIGKTPSSPPAGQSERQSPQRSGDGPGRQQSPQRPEQLPPGPSGGGLIVAEPYDARIPSLKLMETQRLTFRLLRDLDEVGVAVRFLQRSQTQTIVLKKESLQDIPTITSAQFSQEGELNTKVTYDLILERLAEDEKTFRLAILNLPAELDVTFIDPATGASLTQVKFNETLTKLQLNLQIAIPEKLSREFIDQTIEFVVLVTDADGFRALEELQRQHQETSIPLEAIQGLPGEKAMLELIPRGKGALEILITNRYEEIKVGDRAAIRLDLHNTGTLAVEDVRLDTRLPLEWGVTVSPDRIGEVPAGEKEPVNLKVVPQKGIGVGEYEVEVKAMGRVGPETVESTEQVITIRVGARARVVRNTVIIAGLIAVVLGLVVVTVKVSRR